VDPEFGKHRLFHPTPVKPEAEMAEAGYSEQWVTYSTNLYSAKELTVFPGRSVTIHDASAYGVILLQGYGSMGQGGCRNAGPDPLRPDDRGRSLRERLRRQGRRSRHQQKRLREPGDAQHFAPGNPDGAGLIRN